MVDFQGLGLFNKGLRLIKRAALRFVQGASRPQADRPKATKYPPVEKLAVKHSAIGVRHAFDEDLLALGAAADAHVPNGDWGQEYLAIKAAFDPLFYLSQYPDIKRQALDPVGHYLRAGARENRDPTPWFSTAEYRRKYLKTDQGGQNSKINPFYHFLTEGRSAGFAPRSPANYDIFCNSIGLTALATSDLVTRRMDDVRARLLDGELGEMVMKASALDPLINDAWRSGLRVRVPPASNAIGVRRIGHLIDLQHQAGQRRARAVIIVDGRRVGAGDGPLRAIIDQTTVDFSRAETLVVVTGGMTSAVQFDPAIRIVRFGLAMPGAKDYKPGRTLVEFVRSLRPEVVINLNAGLMNSAVRRQGRALAASSTVYQYLPFCEVDTPAQLGARYYRAIDLQHNVIVRTSSARDYLAHAFKLPDAARHAIWVAATEQDQLHPSHIPIAKAHHARN